MEKENGLFKGSNLLRVCILSRCRCFMED